MGTLERNYDIGSGRRKKERGQDCHGHGTKNLSITVRKIVYKKKKKHFKISKLGAA